MALTPRSQRRGCARFRAQAPARQIYEINSNPHLNLRPTLNIPERRKPSLALFRTNYIDAMKAIDAAPRPAWRASSAFVVRALEGLPTRAIHFAGKAAAHLRQQAEEDKPQESGQARLQA